MTDLVLLAWGVVDGPERESARSTERARVAVGCVMELFN